jgi:hypothetical protein
MQRRLQEDAASAGAEAGEQSPVPAIGFIPLTIIPLTFPLSFPSSPVLNGWRQFRDNLRYFEIIRDNLTSRQGESGYAPNAISRQHGQSSSKILTTKNAKITETRTYGVSSLRSLCSLRLIRFWLRRAALGFLRHFAAIQCKRLSMNHLHPKLRRFQSISFKVIQGNSR